MITDAERDAFMRGFDLARPPGSGEADALDRAEEVAPAEPGKLRVAVSIEVAKAIRAETDRLPEKLSGATWLGFLRGTIAKAGVESGEAVHVHFGGRA